MRKSTLAGATCISRLNRIDDDDDSAGPGDVSDDDDSDDDDSDDDDSDDDDSDDFLYPRQAGVA